MAAVALGLAAACVPVVSLLGCGGNSSDLAPEGVCRELHRVEPAEHRNVVLIVADTMRRDFVGVYGGMARTPAFDGFARENLWFARASTQAPWTLPSVATLLTSLYPSQHKLTVSPLPERLARALERRTGPRPATRRRALAPGFTTLAEILHGAGYRTAAVVSNPWINRELGFAQGFDHFDDDLAGWNAPGTRVSDAGLAWLRTSARAPWFLYLHYMDPHRPYPSLSEADLGRAFDELIDDDRPLSDRARAAVVRLVRIDGHRSLRDAGLKPSLTLLEEAYAKGVEAFDHALARFLAGLDRLPGGRDTVVIVTADHGEALFERGYGNHGMGLYDDEVAIPLAMRLPGVASDEPGSAVRCEAGLIDVVPTLCTLLGVPCPDSVHGTSLLRGDGSAPPPRYVLVQGVANRPRHRAIRSRRYKLIYEPDHPAGRPGGNAFALFDTLADPGERHDLLVAKPRPARVEHAFQVLEKALFQEVPPYVPPGKARTVVLDEALKKRLEALGYSGQLGEPERN